MIFPTIPIREVSYLTVLTVTNLTGSRVHINLSTTVEGLGFQLSNENIQDGAPLPLSECNEVITVLKVQVFNDLALIQKFDMKPFAKQDVVISFRTKPYLASSKKNALFDAVGTLLIRVSAEGVEQQFDIPFQVAFID